MRTGFVLLVLVVLVAPVGAVTWDVSYATRGPVSTMTTFYPAGTYEFLLTPNYTTVYLIEPNPVALNSVFLGMSLEPYGDSPAAALPADFPVIAFPVGKDAAYAVPVTTESLAYVGPVVSDPVRPVPEGSTGGLLLGGWV